MTIHRATTAASPSLEALRNRAIDLLEEMYSADLERVPRGDVEDALMTACWVPIQSGYSNDLARLIVRDSIRVLTIFAGRAGTLPFDDRQSLEADVNQVYRMNSSLPPGFDNDETLKDLQSQVRDAALAFREAANADDEFELYKLLVGFKSVYPGSWEANPPDWKADAEYRELQVQRLLETVRPDDSDLWFNRLDSFAATESNDLATFPVLADFVRKLAQQEPAMVLDWVSRGESRLHRFLPGMLSGLMNSNRREDAINLIDKWIRAGDKLSDIAWYLRFADEFDERMLRRTLERAIDKHELAPIRNSLDAAVRQYDKNPGTLIESVFIPAIAALKELNPENWLVSLFTPWMDAPILMALNEEQATAVLDALIAQSRLEYDAEYVVAAVARRWPKRVLEFLSKRQVFKRSPEASQYYDAIPFQAHALREPLMTEPALVLDAAREWFHESPDLFQYDGGVLIASIFPDIDGEFAARMNQMAIEEPLFVLGVLSSYEGKRVIYPFVRQIVAAAEPGSEVLSHAQDALEQSGVVVGEFGFANLSRERQKLITPWLEDDNEVVRDFAKERIAYLERRIAAEVKRAEAGIAARKLDFGEDITETGDEDRDDSNDGDMEEEPHSD
jgi:hypothetical protein